MLVVCLSCAAAHSRGGLVLLSSPQKDQKGKSVEMLLCRTRPYPANQAKPGLEKFAASAHTGPCTAKISYALPLRTRPPSFCLISPEAVLLTGKGKQKAWPLTTRAGQRRGGNDGLAFCVMWRYEVPEQRKKREEPAGSAEASLLSWFFWLLFVSRQKVTS